MPKASRPRTVPAADITELSTNRTIFHEAIANFGKFGHTVCSQAVKWKRFLGVILSEIATRLLEAGYEKNSGFLGRPKRRRQKMRFIVV
jgi:hypothetical protein